MRLLNKTIHRIEIINVHLPLNVASSFHLWMNRLSPYFFLSLAVHWQIYFRRSWSIDLATPTLVEVVPTLQRPPPYHGNGKEWRRRLVRSPSPVACIMPAIYIQGHILFNAIDKSSVKSLDCQPVSIYYRASVQLTSSPHGSLTSQAGSLNSSALLCLSHWCWRWGCDYTSIIL